VIERFLPHNARPVCLLALLCLAPALAAALECNQVAFREIRSTVCRVDLRTDHLQLFLYDGAGMPYKSLRRLADSLRGQPEQLAFAMNAGMFREDYSPLGLLIIESSQYGSVEDPVILATQSGPMMVSAGVIHSGLNPQGTSRNIRNGIGVMNANEVVFAISDEPVTFYEFALLFRDRLKCPDALYLDGSVSSMFVRSLARDDEHSSIGPIIGVTVPAR
jgi:uncharacterized protein YigE (DUF2233 family)